MSGPLALRALMSSCERRGAWTVPSHIDARVTLGSMQLDLRHAELGFETTIDARLTLGSLEILVPRDVAVDVCVDTIAASVDQGERDDAAWSRVRRLLVVGKLRFASCQITRTA
jgi:hypothetical protein